MPDLARPNRLLLLRALFLSPLFLLILLLSIIAYYLIMRYVVLYSNSGLLFFTAPTYLVYAFIITSALLLAIGIYSMRLSILRIRQSVSGGLLSLMTVFAGSLVTSCGCSAPLLGTILYGIGVNIFGVSSAILFINSNQSILIGITIAVNLALLYYYLGKATGSCSIASNKIKVRKQSEAKR